MLLSIYNAGGASISDAPSSHISPAGSVTLDTNTYALSIHDGVTPGGISQLTPAQTALIQQISSAGTIPVTIPNSLNNTVTI